MKNKIRDYRAKLLAVTLLLSGCSGSAPNSGGQPAPAADAEDILAISNPVFMDSLGVVPTKGSYLINVNNLGDKNYSLESVKITDSNGKDQSALLAVSSQMCQRLTANGSCSIEFSPRTASSATLLMTVNLRDSNNEPLKVNQVIRMSDALGANTGISFATELGEVVTEKGDYRITIPVVLNEDFDKVEAFNGSLLCNGGAYKKGNTCTYLISGHALSDNTVVSAKISAYQADNLVFAQAENTTIKIAFIPHLVMSQGVKLQANGESAATIVVYNGGTADESSISYTTNLPGGKLTSNLCGAIKTGKMCDITLQAVSETHGVGNVTAAYGESRQVSTRIAYSGTTKAELKFEAETGDSLENVLLGETANKTIKIKNTGKNGLQAFTVSLLNAGKGLTLDSSDCNRSLAAGGQCSIKINYTPTEAKASSFAEILVTTKYNGGQGELKAYTIRRDIKYSAIDSQNVLAISSPANMTIVADDVSTAKQSVTINRTSAGSLDVNLKSVGLNKIVDKLNIDNSSSCKTTNSILSESKPGCTSDLSYGPVLNPSNKTTSTPDVALSVEYSIGKKLLSSLHQPLMFVRKVPVRSSSRKVLPSLLVLQTLQEKEPVRIHINL